MSRESSFLLTRLLLSGLLVCSTQFPAGAQAVSGTVLGTILDSTNAPVSDAKITLLNTGTNSSQVVTANASGNYTANQLNPGTYQVTVEKQGFHKAVQQNVTVNVAQATRVDITLQLGELTQQLTVTAAPSGLETDRAEVQTHLSAEQISTLPVLNRNFTNLTLLAPGATLNSFGCGYFRTTANWA
jgi:hypothetical protein